MTITRVRPVSVGKIAGFLYGLVGLFVGAMISVFALFGGLTAGAAGAANDAEGAGAAVGALFGGVAIAAIVLVPLFYGLMGFIVTTIMAAIYNLCARVVGGIEVDVT